MEFILSALPSVISGVLIGVLAWFGGKLSGFRDEHRALVEGTDDMQELRTRLDLLIKEHEALMTSQRNQIKAKIVEDFQRSAQRGYITPMELDTVNRLADSYFALGGNHYVHTLMHRMNEEMQVVGEPVPE